MNLVEKTFYSKKTSGLVFELVRIYHIDSDYVKVRGRLWGKDTRILYKNKTYKLRKELIRGWKPLVWKK